MFYRNVADVGFRDEGIDLHFGKIIGDEIEGGGIEAGGNGLADIHVSGNYHAIDRSVDGAVGKLDLGTFKSGLVALDLGLGLKQLGSGSVVIGR